MKKLRLYAVTAITIVLASCSKDETTTPAKPQQPSVREQIAELIHKADAKLYNSLYGNGTKTITGKTSVRYLPGVFYIPQNGNIDDATCLGTNGVCMVIITAAKELDPGKDATQITSDVNESYDPGTAEIIVNDSDSPKATAVIKFKATLKGSDATIEYE